MSGDPSLNSKFRGGFDLGRLRRLAQKELRETLRDRRTVITLLVMPLLVYPILSLIFRTFLLSGDLPAQADKPIAFIYALQSDVSDDEFLRVFREIHAM